MRGRESLIRKMLVIYSQFIHPIQLSSLASWHFSFLFTLSFLIWLESSLLFRSSTVCADRPLYLIALLLWFVWHFGLLFRTACLITWVTQFIWLYTSLNLIGWFICYSHFWSSALLVSLCHVICPLLLYISFSHLYCALVVTYIGYLPFLTFHFASSSQCVLVFRQSYHVKRNLLSCHCHLFHPFAAY